jgi:two-component system nitrate/nitrite response regulator NarL
MLMNLGSPLTGYSERAKMLKTVHISLLGKNEIAREGLRKILSSENFIIKNSLSDAAIMSQLASKVPDNADAHVVVIDYSSIEESLEACRLLTARPCDARLVLLAEKYEFENVALAFQIGVDAVIIKEISCEPLIESISLVALGEKVFPSQLADDLGSCVPSSETGDWRGSASDAGLSAREIDILESIMGGMANKVIARKFDICEATVKVHVKAILRKLGVENRTQAATWAVKHSVSAPMQSASAATLPMMAEIRPSPSYGQAA